MDFSAHTRVLELNDQQRCKKAHGIYLGKNK